MGDMGEPDDGNMVACGGRMGEVAGRNDGGMSMTSEEEIVAALSRTVARRFGAGAVVSGLTRLSGGASQELWSFDVDAEEGRWGLVLRRNPGGVTARATSAGMAAEARLMILAAAAGAPVPSVVHVLTPHDGLGSGFIMERIAGESLAPRILRDPLYAEARPKLARQLGEAAARVHAVAVADAGDLRLLMAEDSLAAAEVLYRACGVDRPVMEWALLWLSKNCPRGVIQPTVVHGDMRNGNIIVGVEGLRALLDWEAVHLGDPMEDLGHLCVTSWRFGQIDRPVGGFGCREDLFSGYEAASGGAVDPARVRFWEVLGTLRWGLICGMMAGEFQSGDRSLEKAAIGRRASETELDLLSILAPRGGDTYA